MNEDQYLISAKAKTLREDSAVLEYPIFEPEGKLETPTSQGDMSYRYDYGKHSLNKLIFFVGHG
jgi:hypothetical protein